MRPYPLMIGLALLALTGCLGHRPAKPNPRLDRLTTCLKTDPCDKVANRRQYYDQRVARYYYFDTKTGRYYWENGALRFPGA